jgi:hypothetical protein
LIRFAARRFGVWAACYRSPLPFITKAGAFQVGTVHVDVDVDAQLLYAAPTHLVRVISNFEQY